MVPVPDTGWALLGLLIFLGVLGAVGACFAWRMASKETEREPKIEVLVGIGGALITGIAVGVSVLYLQQALEESQKYAAWRANVEIAASIPGFSPAGRDIKAINFSGKALHNADLKGADLRNAQLRDTDLTGGRPDRSQAARREPDRGQPLRDQPDGCSPRRRPPPKRQPDPRGDRQRGHHLPRGDR